LVYRAIQPCESFHPDYSLWVYLVYVLAPTTYISIFSYASIIKNRAYRFYRLHTSNTVYYLTLWEMLLIQYISWGWITQLESFYHQRLYTSDILIRYILEQVTSFVACPISIYPEPKESVFHGSGV
jgi:hypothetical protein